MHVTFNVSALLNASPAYPSLPDCVSESPAFPFLALTLLLPDYCAVGRGEN